MEDFKKELKELIKKYNVKLEESDSYDGEENYCGSGYYLKIGKSDVDYSMKLQEYFN